MDPETRVYFILLLIVTAAFILTAQIAMFFAGRPRRDYWRRVDAEKAVATERTRANRAEAHIRNLIAERESVDQAFARTPYGRHKKAPDDTLVMAALNGHNHHLDPNHNPHHLDPT
ncbi:MAG TPA: hypothetical protein VFQ15_01065 [Jiangellaceae bacterium]|nr:hypothetical protein [Jiangellaceae bacterium]